MLYFSIVHLRATYHMSEERIRAYAKDTTRDAMASTLDKENLVSWWDNYTSLIEEVLAYQSVLDYGEHTI